MHLHPLQAEQRTNSPSGTMAEPPPPSQGGPAHVDHRVRNRVLWIAGFATVLALLVLTPPLVNANRYRGRIAQSMSESLGRPVHLDSVSMHLLPVPGFTLQNVVVSEDPAFGAEPTIRANTVEATLRVGSLWHRPVEFSTVRFVEPSVNLVRNATGHWNISDVLLHASHVNSAPTAQRHPGPTPRFPYIEATGGRVNVKFGAEKLPYSLTDADFALWLPSPQSWRVRLIGQPGRTDTNITDPGRVRLEGELRRAASSLNVGANFRASWHNVPLGEASSILTGADRGWRGTMNLDTTLDGTLGAAQVTSKLTLGGLRRAEFFPAHPLDLQVQCTSGFRLHPATLDQVQCLLPDNAPLPMRLEAATVSLQAPRSSLVRLSGSDIPVRWALLWSALFSARVPTDLHPAGTVDIDLTHGPVTTADLPLNAGTSSHTRSKKIRTPPAPVLAAQIAWHGAVRVSLPVTMVVATQGSQENVLTWILLPKAGTGQWMLRLPPTPVVLGPDATVALAATVDQDGYSLSVNGNAPAAALLQPARYLPQLSDGIDKVLPFPPTGTAPAHVQFSCVRTWTALQVCTGAQPGGKTSSPPLPGSVLTSPLQGVPAGQNRLSPRNLSPLENAPFSTPRQ